MALKLKPFLPYLQQFPKTGRELLLPLRRTGLEMQFFIAISYCFGPYSGV